MNIRKHKMLGDMCFCQALVFAVSDEKSTINEVTEPSSKTRK